MAPVLFQSKADHIDRGRPFCQNPSVEKHPTTGRGSMNTMLCFPEAFGPEKMIGGSALWGIDEGMCGPLSGAG